MSGISQHYALRMPRSQARWIGVPDEIKFQTKTGIALEQIDALPLARR
jgi:hypothetical protein